MARLDTLNKRVRASEVPANRCKTRSEKDFNLLGSIRSRNELGDFE